MKTCPACGGRMLRHDRTPIKSTHECKVRLRCHQCGVWESHYYPPGGGAKEIERRPGIDDN